MPSFLSPILREAHYVGVLRNSRNDQILASRLETAFDSRTRRRGLLGRSTFEEDAALIIAPCSSIHTFFMRMAIDVVFAARDGRVLKTYSTLPAWRIGFAAGALAAIELPPGTVARSETRRGDVLELAAR